MPQVRLQEARSSALDVHKDSITTITLAFAGPGPKGDLLTFGTIANSFQVLERTPSRFRPADPDSRLEVAPGNCAASFERR